MATYNNLSYGSSGSEVKKMQQALINAGYDLGSAGADGIFGDKTKAAVMKYQTDNGLSVDGIAGKNTLGALYFSPNKSEQTQSEKISSPEPSPTTGSESSYSPQFSFDPSTDAAYQQAIAALQEAMNQTPTYAGTYDAQLQELYDKIVNRDKFKYDVNGDALYQQYKDQYINLGQLAMMDTMGQAAALTGGYGNSYAQSVGQQTYQEYIKGLTDKIPELYGMALDQYNMEGDRLQDQYIMLGDMKDDEYSRYQDALNEYWRNLDYLKGNVDDAYGRYADEQAFIYQQYMDDIAQQQWQREFDEAQRQFNEQLAENQRQFNEQMNARASVSSGGGSSGGGGGSNNNPLGLSTEELKELQRQLGVTADGIWGPQTEAAYNNAQGGGSDYDKLLGAVSTAKGTTSTRDSATRQNTYRESVSAINDAYRSGRITKEERDSLLRVATPSAR